MSMTQYLVYNEVSPLANTWSGSYKRVYGTFNTITPMSVGDLVASVGADLAKSGDVAVLNCQLWSENADGSATDTYAVDVTFVPNPQIHPMGVEFTAQQWQLLLGLGAVAGFLTKGTISGATSSIGDLISSIMPIMILMMIMPMMQNMMPKAQEED